MKIDINSDLGESFGPWPMGDDASMLDVVSSANIACGFHAGDPAGILKTIKSAVQRNVVIGAHVGYRDLAGFGRRNIDVASKDLQADVIYQIGALQGLATAAGTKVAYVKPHGALYNTISHDKRQAEDVISAILAVDKNLVLMALAGSPIIDWARARGLNVVAEAFADRAYMPDGRLVSRREPGAVITDPKTVASRILNLVKTNSLTAIDGSQVQLQAQSICVHGDSPGAVEIAKVLREHLESAGVKLESFINKNA